MAKMGGWSKTQKKVQKRMDYTSRSLKNSGDAFHNLANQSQSVLNGLWQGGSAMVGMGVGLAAKGATTDAKVAATSDLSAERVRSIADQVYYTENTGRTRQKVAQSAGVLSGRFQGEELMSGVRVSNQMAQLMAKDVNQINKSMIQMHEVFQTTPQQAGDVMAYMNKQAGKNYEDLMKTFEQFSPVFSDMRMDAKTSATTLLAATEDGAQSFKTLSASMKSFYGQNQEKWQGDSAALTDILGGKEAVQGMHEGFQSKSLNGGQALLRTAKGLSGMDQTERKEKANQLFGPTSTLKEAALAMAEAMNSGGAKSIDGMAAKQYGAFSSSEENPMAPLQQTIRNIRLTLKQMGDQILTKLAPKFQAFNQWMKTHEEDIQAFTNSVGALAVVLADKLMQAVQFTIENWDWLKYVLGAVVIGLTALTVAVQFVIPLFRAFAAVIRVLRFLRIIDGLKLLGRQFKKVGRLGKFFGRIFGFIMKWGKRLLPWFLRLLGWGARFIPIIGTVVTLATALWAAFKNWKKIKQWLAPVFNWLQDMLGNVLGYLSDIGGFFKNLFGGGKDDGAKNVSKELKNMNGPENMSGEIPATFSGNMPTTLPGHVRGNAPEGMLGNVPGKMSGNMPEYMTENWLENMPSQTSPDREAFLGDEKAQRLRSFEPGAGHSCKPGDVYVQLQGDHYYHNEMDADRVADKAAQKVQETIQGEFQTSPRGVYG